MGCFLNFFFVYCILFVRKSFKRIRLDKNLMWGGYFDLCVSSVYDEENFVDYVYL